jgi:hypothetical protein
MEPKRPSLTGLLTSAAKQAEALGETLAELRTFGHEQAAVGILDDLKQRLLNGTVASRSDANTAGDQTSDASQTPSEPQLATQYSPRDVGFDAKDIPVRLIRNRNLHATLKADLILLLLARNPGGVTPKDIEEEFSRLKLAEPKGTILSRISRLRSQGWLGDRTEQTSGIYTITDEGLQTIRKALKSYPFQAEF